MIKKIHVFIIIFFLAMSCVALPVLKSVSLTDENMKSYGFSFSYAVDKGSKGLWVISFGFPKVLTSNSSVQRIQTFLLDADGSELSGTSLDFNDKSSGADLLTYFQPRKNDMSIVVQYRCISAKGDECNVAYQVESVVGLVKSIEEKNGRTSE